MASNRRRGSFFRCRNCRRFQLELRESFRDLNARDKLARRFYRCRHCKSSFTSVEIITKQRAGYPCAGRPKRVKKFDDPQPIPTPDSSP